MIEQAERLLRRHSRSGVLFDANLLFIFVLGAVDRHQISLAKRARNFTKRDFDLLVVMTERVERLLVTAYVTTEVSNLATSLSDPYRTRFRELLRALLTNRSTERHIPIRRVIEAPDFDALGVTDAAILRVRKRPPLVVTADWPLAQRLETLGRPVINFNHLRGAALGVYTP